MKLILRGGPFDGRTFDDVSEPDNVYEINVPAPVDEKHPLSENGLQHHTHIYIYDHTDNDGRIFRHDGETTT